MAITAQDRAMRLRQAAAHGRKYPGELFEARMAIHDLLEGTGLDGNRVCELLISMRAPLTEWDCNRLEMMADLIEREPSAQGDRLYRLCDMVKLIAPW